MSERTVGAAVGLAAVAVALTATALARTDGTEGPPRARVDERLSVTSTANVAAVRPGGAVTGTLRITNDSAEPRRVSDVALAPATSDACHRTGLVLAATLAPTQESPVEVPAKGTVVLGWTAYMDGEGEQDCQGATLVSRVSLDGQAAGTVTVVAGRLEQPPAPTGGLTTSTRAAVRWSASTAADPGWVLERAVVGTDDWQPACGSSAQRPLRTPSCTDTGLTRSTTYHYRVTLRTGHWRATSRPGAPVTTQERPSA